MTILNVPLVKINYKYIFRMNNKLHILVTCEQNLTEKKICYCTRIGAKCLKASSDKGKQPNQTYKKIFKKWIDVDVKDGLLLRMAVSK